MFLKREPFTDEEKQLILKIQSEDFILKCVNFFTDRKISIDHINKLDISEGKNILCGTVLWIFTSIGRFDISYNFNVYGGMGILDSKISKKFWVYYKNIIA